MVASRLDFYDLPASDNKRVACNLHDDGLERRKEEEKERMMKGCTNVWGCI